METGKGNLGGGKGKAKGEPGFGARTCGTGEGRMAAEYVGTVEDAAMVRCGGCGREMVCRELADGEKCLCRHCHHLQVLRRRNGSGMGYRAFLALACACLAAVALAGFSLCFLYLSGTGRVSWFLPLCASMMLVVGAPSFLLTRRRNLALLAASLYLPLSLWSFLWSLAPGVDWEYEGSMGWSALFFLALACLGFYIYGRDLRTLARC